MADLRGEGDGGDRAVTFDGGTCACQSFPACELVHVISGFFGNASERNIMILTYPAGEDS